MQVFYFGKAFPIITGMQNRGVDGSLWPGLVGQADGGSCMKNRDHEWGGGTLRAWLCRGGQQGRAVDQGGSR